MKIEELENFFLRGGEEINSLVCFGSAVTTQGIMLLFFLERMNQDISVLVSGTMDLKLVETRLEQILKRPL